MNKKLNIALAIAISVFLFSASANAETFYAYLSSAQEVPPNASTATGYARIVVNESALTINYTIVYNGLAGNQTGGHIHAPAAIGANSGVAIGFPVVGGTSGTITGTIAINATQIAQIRAHQGYVNVHSASFAGGEIRGQLGIKRPVDFDGDGRMDYSILRFPTGTPRPITYWNLNSTTGVQVSGNWGDGATDVPTPGDFDGDGRDDLAYFRAGTAVAPQSSFWILKSSTNTLQYYAWGLFGDIPIARDYDGDGITDVATFRRGAVTGAQSVWYIRQSSTGTSRIVNWGTGNGATANDSDFPIPGDYDGDGKFDVAVYRAGSLTPTDTYIILRSSDGASVYQRFGTFTTDFILPGDYDGDGKFDFAVARTGATAATPMVWWILQSSTGSLRVQQFGISSDRPVQGDYDGDARTDVAIYRSGATATTQSNFWVLRSFDNTIQTTQWGLGGPTVIGSSTLVSDFPLGNFDSR